MKDQETMSFVFSTNASYFSQQF